MQAEQQRAQHQPAAKALASNFVALPVQLIPHSSSSSPLPSSRSSAPPPLSYVFSAWQQTRGRVGAIVLWMLHSTGLYHSSASIAELMRLSGTTSAADAFMAALSSVWKKEASVSRCASIRRCLHHCQHQPYVSHSTSA